jgi:hypothetical protein
MSYEAGGAILIVPAVGAAACAAAAVLAGGVALGAGYLVVQGACKGAKACKDSWDNHLQALEEERQKRFAALRAEDEKRMQRLKENFAELADKGGAFLQEQEEKIRQDLAKEEEKRLEIEQKKTEKLAARKRSELMEQELEGLRKHAPSPISSEFRENKEYLESLEGARAAMQEREEALTASLAKETISTFDNIVAVPAEAPKHNVEGEVINKLRERLAECRAMSVMNLSIDQKKRQELQQSIKQINTALNNEPPEATEKEMIALEKKVQILAEREREYQKVRRETMDCYLSLQEKLITAEMDKPFAELIKEPLQELKIILGRAKTKLNKLALDPQECFAELKTGTKRFEHDCNEKLQVFQNDLNGYVKGTVEKVLAGRKYKKVETSLLDNGAIVVEGTDSPEREDSSIKCIITPKGSLTVDLSHEGFNNQKECDREFRALQIALRKEGVYVDLKRQGFFHNKLQEMGYKPEDIDEEVIGKGIRLVATQAGMSEETIEIDPRKGVTQSNIKEAEMEKEEQISQIKKSKKIIHAKKISTTT